MTSTYVAASTPRPARPAGSATSARPRRTPITCWGWAWRWASIAVDADLGHRLLSLDGPTVYYQTNLGAVAALDAETGGIRWVATYPGKTGSKGRRAATAT